jgi:hypothetical protein
MENIKLENIINQINETDTKTKSKKLEYMLDFGSVSVMVNLSHN